MADASMPSVKTDRKRLASQSVAALQQPEFLFLTAVKG